MWPYEKIPKFHNHLGSPENFIESIDHMTYLQARHLNEPIYKVMIMELYDEGCEMSANYFTCLVLEEQKLFRRSLIKMFVKDKPELLQKLYDNIKVAEKTAKLSHGGGMVACLKILHQTLKVLEAHSLSFDWLLSELYSLFVKIAEKHGPKDGTCNEMMSHLFCSYALYLTNKDDFNKCIHYFEISLELCRGEIWMANSHPNFHDDMQRTLHDAIILRYAYELVQFAKSALYSKPALGSELVQHAIESIFEGYSVATGINESGHQLLLCEAYVLKSALFVERKLCKDALFSIAISEKYIELITNSDNVKHCERLRCELLVQKGICMEDMQDYPTAILLFKESLLISQQFDLLQLQGCALLHMGKIYSRSEPGGKLQATHAYRQAKLIFDNLLDKQNKCHAVYGLAHHIVTDMCSDFLKTIADTSKYCAILKLSKWKDLCQPQWKIEYTVNRMQNPFESSLAEKLKEETEEKVVDENVGKGIIEAAKEERGYRLLSANFNLPNLHHELDGGDASDLATAVDSYGQTLKTNLGCLLSED